MEPVYAASFVAGCKTEKTGKFFIGYKGTDVGENKECVGHGR